MNTIQPLLRQARQASHSLLMLQNDTINNVLSALADAAVANTDRILAENQKDLDRMDPSDARYDRLMLTAERIAGIAADIRNVASLPSPLGKTLDEQIRPNGMRIRKVSVPFGVIGVIYEARPNVSFDVFSLCFKTANACILKGGTDAEYSNRAIVEVIHQTLQRFDIDPAVCTLLPSTREATAALLKANETVDLIIPRGSSSLINFVRENATVPVIETGAGICHTYFDKSGDTAKGASIIENAKTRRVSVCNALDCLLIHKDRLIDLSTLVSGMASKNVIIFADAASFDALVGHYPTELLQKADEDSFGTEFLDYKMAIKTVGDIGEALEHIRRYSSKHSESIVAEDDSAQDLFRRMVDAACVYTNVSTAFTDGAQFGFGAEIGISTQKLHARGPMALAEITSYKYLIDGDGQIRSN